MNRFRRVLRRDVLMICVVIFLADFVTGVLSPTFPLFAEELGASLAYIGLLGSLVGLTRLLTSMPIGALSDLHGRRRVIAAGMLFFSLSTFLYTIVSDPLFLLPLRALYGMALTATFFIGIAYVGDIVPRADRGLAVGLYTSAMGLGFAVGPLFGGFVSERLGLLQTYRLTALIGFIGFILAVRFLHPPTERQKAAARIQGPSLWRKFGLFKTNPELLAASLGNLSMTVIFSGAIMNFFPLYAASLNVSQVTLGSMFALRALLSTAVRLPTGLLSVRISSRHLMLAALLLAIAMSFAIANTSRIDLLSVWLALEGIAFGMFLTAGQAYVTEHAADSERGTAVGLYSTAASLGSTAGPLLLGLAAQHWSLSAVFWLTGLFALLGTALLWTLQMRRSIA